MVDKIKKDTTLSIDEKNEQFKNIITFIHYFIKKLFQRLKKEKVLELDFLTALKKTILLNPNIEMNSWIAMTIYF